MLVFENGDSQQDQIIEKISQLTPNYKNVSPEVFWDMLRRPLNLIKAMNF